MRGARSLGLLVLITLTLWSGGIWTPFVLCFCADGEHLVVEHPSVPCCPPDEAAASSDACCEFAPRDCAGCVDRPLTGSFTVSLREDGTADVPAAAGDAWTADDPVLVCERLMVDPRRLPPPPLPPPTLRC